MNEMNLPSEGRGQTPEPNEPGPVRTGTGHEPAMSVSPRPPRRSRRRLIMGGALTAAAVALAVTGATLIAGHTSSATASMRTGSASARQTSSAASTRLTTSAVVARIDPGLVDVNVVFGYQGARGAGTGMVLTPSGEV